MEGFLLIPDELGDPFRHHVGRCVRFSSDEVLDEASSFYKEAVAIYIRTMRIGLEHAITMRANMNAGKGAVSLCCSPPRPELQLLASPTPHAQQTNGMRICQGELYKLEGVNVDGWMKGLVDPSLFSELTCQFPESLPTVRNHIVKLSCKTVHNSFVPLDDSWFALQFICSNGPSELKMEITKSLRACAYLSRRYLVTVMLDLSTPEGTTLVVSPALFKERVHLWDAFTKLVTTVLIPMAEMHVIHADIRSQYTVCL
jgi:hypothetical protein